MDQGTGKLTESRMWRRGWMLFRRRKETPATSSRWKFLFRWKPRLNVFHRSFLYDVAFKIASVTEAIVLVATLCFFYLCCGCNF